MGSAYDPERPNLAIHGRWSLSTPAQMTWLSGLEVHIGLVMFRSVLVTLKPGAEVTNKRKPWSVKGRNKKAAAARVIGKIPQMTAATAAPKLLNQKEVG